MRWVGVIAALGALLGLLAGMATAAPALPRGPKWQFQPAGPFTLDASFCGFEIGVSFPVDKQYAKVLKAADGSMSFLITGAERVSLTNLETGKTLTESLSGPAKFTVHPDGPATSTGRDEGWPSSRPPMRRGRAANCVRRRGRGNGGDRPGRDLYRGVPASHVLVDVCAALS